MKRQPKVKVEFRPDGNYDITMTGKLAQDFLLANRILETLNQRFTFLKTQMVTLLLPLVYLATSHAASLSCDSRNAGESNGNQNWSL